MKKFVFEGGVSEDDVVIEDGGCYKEITLQRDDEGPLHVKISSWDDEELHDDFNQLEGRTIRVTIEILD